MTSPNFMHLIPAFSLLFAATIATAQDHPASREAFQPGKVVISGTVPDESTKAALIAKLQQVYGSSQIVDQISVGGVIAPPNWSAHVTRLISANLKSISKGQLVIEGTNVAMRGEVKNEAIRQSVASDFANALNTTYVIKNGLRVTGSGQAVVDQTLANRIVEFESGSALLTDAGKAVLDEMAEALKKVSFKKVEIIGHTDNLGAPARNLALSRARADSVKTYLVVKGVPSELIGTSGMGADQPIVSNATDEGRKRNRRIEFRISQ